MDPPLGRWPLAARWSERRWAAGQEGGTPPVEPSPGAGVSTSSDEAASPVVPSLDPVVLANRELIRPVAAGRAAAGLVPFSTAWFEELEQKRYQRHGYWLPGALEFDRHAGERILLLGAGLGNDALRYAQAGAYPIIALGPDEPAAWIRRNLERHDHAIPCVPVGSPPWPFADAYFDVVVCNGLYSPGGVSPELRDEWFRLLKPGGKLIALFPAYYDTAYWQDRLLPLQWMYWQRPADPTTGPKVTGRQVRRLLERFTEVRICKRHLRRSELPHPWRVLPLGLLERLMGRVLVAKALKPLGSGDSALPGAFGQPSGRHVWQQAA